MKLRLLAAATIAALALTAGAASAQDTTSEKGKLSYALGYRAGLDIARVVSSGEQLDMATVTKAFQDASGRKDPAVSSELLAAAMQGLQNRMSAKAKAEMEKRAADNKTKGDAFLAQNKGKPGVKVLASGVQYREIESGNGAAPTPANQISVEFKSTLPDGSVIADTTLPSEGQPAGPVTVRLSEIPLPGLREALQMMPAGARWEVVLPGSAAHGTTIDRAGEMANQVVIFNIKLTNVGPVVAAPAKPQR
ncbi:MAG: FKBP-type peptidyl-prolyl cis-trans isomerase [Gammaproteobacteria bacterium]|nr:FKBP-type peptidyl-prolyl cis-trans isomerase [Gammaproteobacteria bacterium]